MLRGEAVALDEQENADDETEEKSPMLWGRLPITPNLSSDVLRVPTFPEPEHPLQNDYSYPSNAVIGKAAYGPRLRRF